MPSRKIGDKLAKIVSNPVVHSALPISLLSIVMEAIFEANILCPCTRGENISLIVVTFLGPFLFLFTVMIALLRPCHTNSARQNDAEGTCCEKVSYCFIPPFIWVTVLFLDGDYLACCSTQWEGYYVFDEEIKKKWCEPIALTNTSDLRRDYQWNIWISQVNIINIII